MTESPKMKIDLEADVEKFVYPVRRLAIALEIAATDEVLLEEQVAIFSEAFDGLSPGDLSIRRDRTLELARDTLLTIEYLDRKIAEKKKVDQS